MEKVKQVNERMDGKRRADHYVQVPFLLIIFFLNRHLWFVFCDPHNNCKSFKVFNEAQDGRISVQPLKNKRVWSPD